MKIVGLCIILMLTSCLITKKNPKELTDLFSPTSKNPKSIVFRSDIDRGPMLVPYFEYYIFFPEEHIFLCYSTRQMSIARLGYYEFIFENNENKIYLQQATKYLKDVKMGLQTNQGDKDSLYFHIQIEKTATIFPTTNDKLGTQISNYKDSTTYISLSQENISTNYLVNTLNKDELIISISRLDNIRKIKLDMGLFTKDIYIDIKPEYNYYYISGHICQINSKFISLADADRKYTETISKIAKNTYNFKTEGYYEGITDAKYKRIRLNALDKSERTYIYALPQYIKALECAGTYPQK
jgi:hypothetical protein